MPLAGTFEQIVESLPDDWTDLELDVRIFDERRYVDAALLLVTCNAQPYSKHDWHWRLLVAHRFDDRAVLACDTTLRRLEPPAKTTVECSTCSQAWRSTRRHHAPRTAPFRRRVPADE